jgi:DNA-binding IclR family transcriptional regulator
MAAKFSLEPRRGKVAGVPYEAGHAQAERKGVASVETAVAILRVLDFAAGPLSLSQVARVAGFRASKTHHHLVSLVRTELAHQDPDTGLYSLGEYARRLGTAARHKGVLAPLVSDAMRSFSRGTRQSAMFTQWSKQGPVVTYWSDGRRALSVSSRIGAVVPLWGSPTGDIFLAWLPEKTLQRAMQDGLLGEASERQVQLLRARVRREGAAHAGGRRNAAIAAVAAPVFDAAGALAGAITALGLRGDLDDAPGSSVDTALRAAAAAVSAALGSVSGARP